MKKLLVPIGTSLALSVLSHGVAANDSIDAYQARLEERSSPELSLSSVVGDLVGTVLENTDAPARAAATAVSDSIRGGAKDAEINIVKIDKNLEVLDVTSQDGVVVMGDTVVEDVKLTQLNVTQKTHFRQVDAKKGSVIANNLNIASFSGSNFDYYSKVKGGNLNAKKDSLISLGNTTVGKNK